MHEELAEAIARADQTMDALTKQFEQAIAYDDYHEMRFNGKGEHYNEITPSPDKAFYYEIFKEE